MARILQWLLLASSAIAATWLLHGLRVPGAALLGPMAAAVAFALCGTQLRLKAGVLVVAQAVLGCMVASVFDRSLARLIGGHWPVVLAVNVASVLAAFGISVAMTRFRWLPGQSAIWGLSPGAASTMMLLGEQHGEDPRVIAMMQQLRILFVACAAISVAGLFSHAAEAPPAAGVFPQVVDHRAYAMLFFLVSAGVGVSVLWKRPQAAFWVPTIAGSAFHVGQLAPVETPQWLAAAAFAISGCYAGLKFTREALSDCLRLLPAMLGGIAAMVLSTAVLVWPILAFFDGIDALTAFLATTPGGIDTAVAVASGTRASVPVIVAVQVTRLLVVTWMAPRAAKLLAQHLVR